MRAGDLMQDPYYARLIFEIESHVHDYDMRILGEEGVKLKDSDIKSGLRKALGLLRGSGPLKPPKNKEERLKGALALELVGIYEYEAKTAEVSRGNFGDALLAVEDTLKLRRDAAGHSRGYLDFLQVFIPEARGNQPKAQ